MTEIHPVSQPTLLQYFEHWDAPIIIGISGDSGSGKTRFSAGIRKLLGPDMVKTIEMDGYHKENREQRKVSGKLPLDPSANRFDLLVEHLRDLKQKKTIDVPIYNHDKGDFDEPREFVPSPVVLVEGLHALYPEFIEYMDFTIFVDPSRDVKWQWKKRRDMEDRGHEWAALEEEMLKREAAYKRWIDFQKTNATIVVKIFKSTLRHFARYEFTHELNSDCYKVELLIQPPQKSLPKLVLPFDLGMITDISVQPFLLASVPGKYWGRDTLNVHIDGEFSQETVSALQCEIETYTGIPCELDDPQSDDPPHPDTVTSTRFAQLLITWRFLEYIHGVREEKVIHTSS